MQGWVVEEAEAEAKAKGRYKRVNCQRIQESKLSEICRKLKKKLQTLTIVCIHLQQYMVLHLQWHQIENP
jgi:hypothetical protein